MHRGNIRMPRWLVVLAVVGLIFAVMAPAGAAPGKVIKSTGKDATTMSAQKVLDWAIPASVTGDATILASWGSEYPLQADVHLSGGTFTWNYPGGAYITGTTSNLSVVGNVATFQMTVTESTHSVVQAGWVLGLKITDGTPDTVAWWWVSGSTGSIPATPVVDGDFVVTPSSEMRYDNACVHDAIAKEYKGKINMIQPAGNVDIILGMSFANLDAGTYTVFLDGNGGTPGGWTALGTFVADMYGDGDFNYKLPAGSLTDGNYKWSIWVNGPIGACGSILQTDADLEFTIGTPVVPDATME